MSISYTNDLTTNLSDPLQLLMFTELKPIPVINAEKFDASFMTRGKYVRYWFLGSSKETNHSDGETRNYEFEIVYYFDTTRHSTKKAFDYYTADMEHIKRLLENNESYTTSSTYRWHEMVVEQDRMQTVGDLEETDANIEDDLTSGTVAGRFLVTIRRSNFR